MEKEIPALKKKFLHFESYAGKTFDEIYSPEELKNATILTVNETRSTIFLNNGQDHFTKQPLPVEAQLSPVFAAIVQDLNGDGLPDIFLGGNFYGVKPQTGRFDASYGTCLLGTASQGFHYLRPKQSGLFVRGEVRDAAVLNPKSSKPQILVARNNDSLLLFQKD